MWWVISGKNDNYITMCTCYAFLVSVSQTTNYALEVNIHMEKSERKAAVGSREVVQSRTVARKVTRNNYARGGGRGWLVVAYVTCALMTSRDTSCDPTARDCHSSQWWFLQAELSLALANLASLCPPQGPSQLTPFLNLCLRANQRNGDGVPRYRHHFRTEPLSISWRDSTDSDVDEELTTPTITIREFSIPVTRSVIVALFFGKRGLVLPLTLRKCYSTSPVSRLHVQLLCLS